MMLAVDFGEMQAYTYTQKTVGKSIGLLPTEGGRRRVVWHPLTGPFKLRVFLDPLSRFPLY